jgi:hypothetical protein
MPDQETKNAKPRNQECKNHETKNATTKPRMPGNRSPKPRNRSPKTRNIDDPQEPSPKRMKAKEKHLGYALIETIVEKWLSNLHVSMQWKLTVALRERTEQQKTFTFGSACSGSACAHLHNFKEAEEDSQIFFGSDKVNYMRKMLRHAKECQDAVVAADEALVETPDCAETKSKFLTFQVLLKKLEAAINCVKVIQASGLNSTAFSEAMRKELHIMSLAPVVSEDIFPTFMHLYMLKNDLTTSNAADMFWQKISAASFEKFRLSSSQIVQQQEAALGDRVVSFIQGGGTMAAFTLWLLMSLDFDVYVPDELAEQMIAICVVLHCDNIKLSEEAKDIELAISVVHDKKRTLAHTLMLYPCGKALVQAAEARMQVLLHEGATGEQLKDAMAAENASDLEGMEKISSICGEVEPNQAVSSSLRDLVEKYMLTHVVASWQATFDGNVMSGKPMNKEALLRVKERAQVCESSASRFLNCAGVYKHLDPIFATETSYYCYCIVFYFIVLFAYYYVTNTRRRRSSWLRPSSG